MRISGGKARGVTLKVDKKAVHRPAMDKLRQSIFSSIGPAVEAARVADLFAGTGSYGLEALSRGAAHCAFVELNPRAVAMIKANQQIVAKSMGEPQLAAEHVSGDVLKWTPAGEAYDILFVDPPYDLIEELTPKLFALFDKALAPDGLVVFETPGRLTPLAPGWRLRKRLGKGLDQATACLIERED